MGELQSRFVDLLGGVGKVTAGRLQRPTRDTVTAHKDADRILAVYRELGGVQEAPSIRPGAWDLEWDGIAVELDEQLHFNRYRATTLRSPLYNLLERFPRDAYLTYCHKREPDCVAAGSYGKKWSSSSCESQFGMAGQPRDLTGRGAPRWRQRAFYDFVKDVSPMLTGVPVARIAIWDSIRDQSGERHVLEALRAPSADTATALAALVQQRAT